MVRAVLSVDLCHSSSAKAIDQLCWDLYNLSYAANDAIDQDRFEPELDVPVQVVCELSNDVAGALLDATRRRVERRNKPNAPNINSDNAVPRIVIYSRYELAIVLGQRANSAEFDAKYQRILHRVEELRRAFPKCVLAPESVPKFVLNLQQHARRRESALRHKARVAERKWCAIVKAFPQLQSDCEALQGYIQHSRANDMPANDQAASLRAPTTALAQLLGAKIKEGGGSAQGTVLAWKSAEMARAAFEAVGLVGVRDLPRFSGSELVAAMNRLLATGATGANGPKQQLANVLEVTKETLPFGADCIDLNRLQEMQLLQGWCMKQDLMISTRSSNPCDRDPEAHVFLRDAKSTPGFLGCWLFEYTLAFGSTVVAKLARSGAIEPPIGFAYWGMTQITIPRAVGRLPLDVAARALLTMLGASTRFLNCALCKQPVAILPDLLLTPQQCARFSCNDGCGAPADVAGVIATFDCPHVYHRCCIEAMRTMTQKRGGNGAKDVSQSHTAQGPSRSAEWTCHLCSAA